MAACAAVAVVGAGVAIVPGGREWTALRIVEAAAEGRVGPQSAQQALLALGEDVTTTLATVAISEDLGVATHARRAIDTRVDVWLSRPTPERGRRLAALLGAMEDNAPDATQSGLRWAKRLAQRTLDIDDRLDEPRRVAVIRSADRLLERLARVSGRAEDEPAIAPPTPEPTFPHQADIAEAQAIATRRAEREAARAGAAKTAAIAIATPPTIEAPPPPAADPPVATPEPSWDPGWKRPLANITRESIAPAEEAEPASPPPAPPTPIPYAERGDLELLGELLRRSDEVRQLTEAQSKARSARGPRSAGEPPAKASDSDPRELVAELTHRGYTGVSVADLEAIACDDPRARRRLADRLLVAQTADAARLLLALTTDPDGGVREAAVTALGSSPHRAHVEAAWRIALHDADPRVGRHASRLRARLE